MPRSPSSWQTSSSVQSVACRRTGAAPSSHSALFHPKRRRLETWSSPPPSAVTDTEVVVDLSLGDKTSEAVGLQTLDAWQ